MSSEKKPQPVAYRVRMDNSFGEWPDSNLEAAWKLEKILHDGHQWDIVEPLYHEATIEALRAERDEAQRVVVSSWNAFGGPQAETAVEVYEWFHPAEGDIADQIEALTKQRDTAEARVAQLEKRIFEITEYDMDVCYAHTQLRALLSDGGRDNG